MTPIDPKLHELARLGIRNQNGSKLFRRAKSSQVLEIEKLRRESKKQQRKNEKARKQEQRRKARR